MKHIAEQFEFPFSENIYVSKSKGKTNMSIVPFDGQYTFTHYLLDKCIKNAVTQDNEKRKQILDDSLKQV